MSRLVRALEPDSQKAPEVSADYFKKDNGVEEDADATISLFYIDKFALKGIQLCNDETNFHDSTYFGNLVKMKIKSCSGRVIYI